MSVRPQPDSSVSAVQEYLLMKQSCALQGEVLLTGSKNATLPIMASLILSSGTSTLANIPDSADVHCMIELLKELGARVNFDIATNVLTVDTSSLHAFRVNPDIMKKMRASVLVMGPLLARFKRAEIALPGGCAIGARPIDFHIANAQRMGATCDIQGSILTVCAEQMHSGKFVLDYPSVGATENLMMAAALTPGVTTIINAAIEPEVLDVIAVLKKMGAHISVLPAATIVVEGVKNLQPICHEIIADRLEAGGLLLAAAVTGGSVYIPQAREDHLETFLFKLQEMGHTIEVNSGGVGIRLTATNEPRAVSFITGPFPGFPTDLQAPMMAALCLAQGTSVIRETVYENRLIHVKELQKFGADIRLEGDRAHITGVKKLCGSAVEATDIRASCALALAGLAAQGETRMTGLHHWRRGYQAFETKLAALGADIQLKTT